MSGGDGAVLRLDRVEKHFGDVVAVDGVSFSVRPGSIMGLLGRNGAGKTTALRIVNGIFLPDRGSVELFEGASSAAARDRIGYLPEERGLYKQMKVWEHLMFLAEIKGRKRGDVKESTERWLDRLELSGRRDAKVEELSKGNQQKVQLIGALLHEPELIILDEPLSGLDPVNVVLVRTILKEMRRQGRAILLSTHMMGEAERMVDDLVLIHEGRVVLSGSLGEVRAASRRQAVHLRFEGDGSFLSREPGVERASVLPNSAELSVSADLDPNALLAAAMAKLRIMRFEVEAPSLEEIFIERVGAGARAPSPDGEDAS